MVYDGLLLPAFRVNRHCRISIIRKTDSDHLIAYDIKALFSDAFG